MGASAIRVKAIHGTKAVRSVIMFIMVGKKDSLVDNSFVLSVGSLSNEINCTYLTQGDWKKFPAPAKIVFIFGTAVLPLGIGRAELGPRPSQVHW